MLKIPLSFLRSLAVEKQLSEGELEVLYQIADNQPLEVIAEELGTSLSAIHQRLAQMYSKFDIQGKGPGKLSRLQLLLTSEHEKSLSSNENLISSENNPSPSSYRNSFLVKNSVVRYNSGTSKFDRHFQPSDWIEKLQRIETEEDKVIINEFSESLSSALDYLNLSLKSLLGSVKKIFLEQEKDQKYIPTAEEVQLPLEWIKSTNDCTTELPIESFYSPIEMEKENVLCSQDVKLQEFSETSR